MAARERWVLWAVALIVVVTAGGVIVWKLLPPGERPATGTQPRSFTIDAVKTECPPGLHVEILDMRGNAHPQYTDWAFTVRCLEPKGCSAESLFRVFYLCGGEEQHLDFAATLMTPDNGETRVVRVQRPPQAVDGISRVEVKLLRAIVEGAPPPTPRL
jgi:hypothetical protein